MYPVVTSNDQVRTRDVESRRLEALELAGLVGLKWHCRSAVKVSREETVHVPGGNLGLAKVLTQGPHTFRGWKEEDAGGAVSKRELAIYSTM